MDCSDKESIINKIFLKQNETRNAEKDMWTLIEVLIKDLELSKENEKITNLKIKELLENDQIDAEKYITLQGKISELEKENENLKNEVDDVTFQLIGEKEALKADFFKEKENLVDKYNLENSCLKSEIEALKQNFYAKETELQNKLQVVQASAAMQCDEIESELKRQLVDVNNKLRESQNSNRTVQTELLNLKAQYNINCQKLNEVQNKLQEAEAKIKCYRLSEAVQSAEHFQSMAVSYSEASRPESNVTIPMERYSATIKPNINAIYEDFPQPRNNTISSSVPEDLSVHNQKYDNSQYKYQPLDVTYRNPRNLDYITRYEGTQSLRNSPTVYATGKVSAENIYKRKAGVPPLKPCSDSGIISKTKNQKKRKLYNPNNLDYLDHVEEEK